ncbi:MAG: hypothetical protein ACQET5_05275 [Halobacteriota archaeon]|uniref:hypothetical protein n=1 Tax=Natronomonas sp. TaxID=2184060 RepID=UPI0039756665
MPVKKKFESEKDLLTQLTGFTGIGWTTSMLGYLGTMIGYGNNLVIRFGDPQSLLYLGIGFFVATLGLDRIRDARSNDDE